MKRLLRISMALGLLAAITAGPALAGPGGPCGGHRREKFENGINALGLPAETNQAVFAALDKAHDEQRTLMPEMRAAHERMKALLATDNPSVDAVTAEADTIGALRTRMGHARLQALVTIRSLLTAAQWQQLQETMHQGKHLGGYGGDDGPVS